MSSISFTQIQQQWESFIYQYLYPVIIKCGEPLEGNILTHHQSLYKNAIFVKKQINIHALLSSLKKENEDEKIIGLEIGFNSGFSSLLMLMSNPNLYLTCVDINDHSYTTPCYQVLKSFFGDRIHLIPKSSTIAIPEFIEEERKFDFIHIDGCHETEVVIEDIDNCMKCCKEGTIILMDDTEWGNINEEWNKAIQKYNLKNYNIQETVECREHNFKLF